jgi:hypothetical protein
MKLNERIDIDVNIQWVNSLLLLFSLTAILKVLTYLTRIRWEFITSGEPVIFWTS